MHRHHLQRSYAYKDRSVCRIADREFEGYPLVFAIMSSPNFPWDAATPARGSVLLYGRDAALLRTRLWILEGAGFQVWAATRRLEVEEILGREHIDLLVLCYTLSIKQCDDALARARMLQPRTKTMMLTEMSFPQLKTGYDGAVNALGHPETMIAAVKRMVNPAASIGSSPLRISPSESFAKLHQ